MVSFLEISVQFLTLIFLNCLRVPNCVTWPFILAWFHRQFRLRFTAVGKQKYPHAKKATPTLTVGVYKNVPKQRIFSSTNISNKTFWSSQLCQPPQTQIFPNKYSRHILILTVVGQTSKERIPLNKNILVLTVVGQIEPSCCSLVCHKPPLSRSCM